MKNTSFFYIKKILFITLVLCCTGCLTASKKTVGTGVVRPIPPNNNNPTTHPSTPTTPSTSTPPKVRPIPSTNFPPPNNTTTKPTTTTPNPATDTLPHTPPTPTTATPTPPLPTTPADTTTLNPFDQTSNKPAKQVLDIALLLPFNAYYALDTAGNFNPKQQGNNTVLAALDFYEGVHTALEELGTKGTPLTVGVFDIGTGEDATNQLLDNPDLQNMDLIIGPINNAPLKLVAEFAKQNKIYHISPLSPATNNATQNPYYLIANPTIETHLANIYNYVAHQNNPNSQRIIALCDDKPNEIKLANTLYEYSKIQKNEAPILVQQITGTANLEGALSATEQNYVVVTSFNEIFANTALLKLKMLAPKYPITLIGMPNWKEMETIDIEYLASLNFHYTTPIYTTDTDYKQNAFKQTFFQKYKTKPSENAILGYNLMLYIGELIKKYGSDFGKNLNDQTIRPPHIQYEFLPAAPNQYSSPILKPDYLENKHVHIIKLKKDFTFEKIK